MMTISKKRQLLQWVLGVVIVLVMLMIFLFSAQSGDQSSNVSKKVLDAVIGWFKPLMNWLTGRQMTYGQLVHIIRKLGHFGEYALLGLLLWMMGKVSRWKHPVKVALISAVAYAATDEIHQVFSANRGPSVNDVWIDGAGAMVGILLAVAIYMIVRQIRRHCRKQ